MRDWSSDGALPICSPSAPLRNLINPVRIEVTDPYLRLNVDRPEDLDWLADAFAGL